MGMRHGFALRHSVDRQIKKRLAKTQLHYWRGRPLSCRKDHVQQPQKSWQSQRASPR